MKLELNNLTKKYDSKTAVNHVSAVFEPGIYGLLGANGAGKTTLMRMICDVLSPTAGRITADGISITAMGEDYRCHLGYLPQSFGYYPDFTAREFMAYIAALKGIRKPFARKQTANLLEMVSLTDVADKKIRTFSGGMKRRLGIAQAVLGNPDLLILDEPTVGLDPKERVRFRNLIADLAKDKIVILSTHIVSDVEYIADHILLMKSGRLLLSQPADEIIHAMDGKVWTCHLLREQADRLNTCCTVVNLHHNGTKYVTVRIVADKKPFDNAILMEPTLEDLYLYYFQNKDRKENNQ
ncbi:MAG: ABC transporter ATP-binding protein [Coprococcus sp.]